MLRMREEMRSFMNIGSSGSPNYNLIGEGFSELTIGLNPVEYSRHYIHNKNATTDITGYAPEMTFSADLESADPVIDFISEKGLAQKTGSELETEIVNAYMWKDEGSGYVEAYRQRIAIKLDNSGSGPGGEVLKLEGALMYKGDPEKGKFNPETGTFEASTGAVYLVTFEVKSGGTAIPQAQVIVGSTTLVTNSNGFAEILLQAGTHSYNVIKEGYNTVTDSVTVSTSAIVETVEMTST